MTKEEKLEVLKDFLRKEKIGFKEKCLRNGQFTDLFIPKYLIAVRISTPNDQKFYEKVKYYLHPLFIRDSETAEFVVEKMQNLIIDLMKKQQKMFEKKKK